VEALAPRIAQITRELIDAVQHQAAMDFMHDLAIPVPVIVIAEILGVPVGDPDEAQFEYADGFVINRDPNPHLAFGNGIHFCLGASLARLETKIVLSAVLERLPNLRILSNREVGFIPSIDVHGVKSLPVSF
jgi:cytochrome P450